MNDIMYENYLNLLKSELKTALGCTEPIAVAFAAARAREILGEFPEKAIVYCSANIVKNVKSVIVPNSGGMVGIGIAAILGIVCGESSKELEVLEKVTDQDRLQAKYLFEANFCECKLQENVNNLYISVYVESADHSAQVTVAGKHTFISKVVKDNQVLSEYKSIENETPCSKLILSVKEIIEFAKCLRIEDVKEIIGKQISFNNAISQEGLRGRYGAEIGRLLIKHFGNGIKTRAVAAASAGSDARMGGCPLPVVINSGSGNQGLTVSLPVLEYAKELGSTEDKTYRALAMSNLISVHIKAQIGDLSAFCGAVSASCGAGAAITYLNGGSERQIENTIVNTIANVGGIICDGAKASCAAKIASSVNAAILGHLMSMDGIVFQNEEGIVQDDIESTIKSVAHIGSIGMKETDLQILKVMLKETTFI
ncbi:MAG: L-serine ammonia-lyase, iron-sulfur-dependent, subunit alpha [Oscillospiraceae bacterium]